MLRGSTYTFKPYKFRSTVLRQYLSRTKIKMKKTRLTVRLNVISKFSSYFKRKKQSSSAFTDLGFDQFQYKITSDIINLCRQMATLLGRVISTSKGTK